MTPRVCTPYESTGGGKPLQDRSPAITRLRSQVLLDTQKLVVFRSPIRAGQRSCLDLSAIRGDGEVRNGGVLSLAGTVRHDATIGRFVGHLDRRERLGQ